MIRKNFIGGEKRGRGPGVVVAKFNWPPLFPLTSLLLPSLLNHFQLQSPFSPSLLFALSFSNPRKFAKTPLLAFFSNNFDATPFHDAFGSNPTPSMVSFSKSVLILKSYLYINPKPYIYIYTYEFEVVRDWKFSKFRFELLILVRSISALLSW